MKCMTLTWMRLIDQQCQVAYVAVMEDAPNVQAPAQFTWVSMLRLRKSSDEYSRPLRYNIRRAERETTVVSSRRKGEQPPVSHPTQNPMHDCGHQHISGQQQLETRIATEGEKPRPSSCSAAEEFNYISVLDHISGAQLHSSIQAPYPDQKHPGTPTAER